MGGNKELIQNPTFGIFEPPYYVRPVAGAGQLHLRMSKAQCI